MSKSAYVLSMQASDDLLKGVGARLWSVGRFKKISYSMSTFGLYTTLLQLSAAIFSHFSSPCSIHLFLIAQ